MRVAITGASGFVGNRIIESFFLGKVHDVVALARSNSGLALPARFDLPRRVCDHFSVEELAGAFEGCEAVVHTAFGSPLDEMNRAIYLAADRAGVRRVVVLSSASIYNQNPEVGTTEESPLPTKPATPYNATKIIGDEVFRRLRARGKTEVVFLMPGIVFGPRSQWVANLAKKVSDGTAYLLGGGGGICNSVYVDNLVEAVRLALSAPGVDGESFFISDSETVTWADFYRPVVAALGAKFEELHFADPPVFTVSAGERMRGRIQGLASSKRVQKVKPHVPRSLVKVYKRAMFLASGGGLSQEDAWSLPEQRRPDITLEMSLLHQCAYKLPNAKAERLLNYRPVVNFAEGMKRSVAWLEFAGYPVSGAD